MNPHDPHRDQALDERLVNELAPLLDRHWEALLRGEPIEPASWAKEHPEGARGLSDFRVLAALFVAAAAVHEDSHAAREDRSTLPSKDADAPSTEAFRPPGNDLFAKAMGDRVGKYELRDVLGRGGQAVTFKAWDPDAQRTVVIKAFHTTGTAASDAVVEEGQKLAKVRSPYVVQCYHVERLAGQRCLILEYVPGPSLSQLHSATPLSVSKSLALIAQVAEGVAAVHACGLLHRDIKPGNIVVGPDGAPKLLDFGLAKSLGDPTLGDPTGTFAYMAPEQARGDVDRVDPRTDIFGLGATLYFLLTGSAPYQGNRDEIRQAARAGVIIPPRHRNRQIPADVNRLCLRCLAPAPEQRFASAKELANALRRPSRTVRKFAAAAVVVLMAALAAIPLWWNRAAPSVPTRIESVQLVQMVRNTAGLWEPQGVVGRDPYRLRFGDGLHLRAKLARPAYCYWLSFSPDGLEEVCFPTDATQPPPRSDAPIYPAADRPNLVYGLTDAVGLQAFVLVISETPLPAYNDWRKARPACPWPAKGEATLTALRRHNGDWEETLPLDPFTPRGKDEVAPSVENVLDDLVAWVRSNYVIGDGEPPLLIDAWAIPVVRRESAKTPGGGVDAAHAESSPPPSTTLQYETELGEDDARKVSELAQRIDAALQSDLYHDAVQLCEEVLALRGRVQGDNHWETISAKWSLDALRKTAALPPDRRAAWREAKAAFHKAQQHLRGGEGAKGEAAQAEPALRNYAEWCSDIFGPKHPETAVALHELAVSLNKQAEYGQAEVAHRSALDALLESYGDAHPETATSYSSLAKTLNAQGRSFYALPLYRKALNLRRTLLGERHPLTAAAYNNVAHTLKEQAKFAEAEPYFEKALEIKRDTLGERDRSTIIAYNNLGANLNDQEKQADAQVLFEKALELCHTELGGKDVDTVWTYSNLATCLNDQGRFVEAQPICHKALELSLEVLEPAHPDTAWAYLNLAQNLAGQKLYSEAQPHFQSALELRVRLLGEKHPDTASIHMHLAINLAAQNKADEARHHGQLALDLFRKANGEKHPKTASPVQFLARDLATQGKCAEAVALLRQAAAAYEVARLNVSARGIDRAAFGQSSSPYDLLAALLARLGSPAEAWMAAEMNLARSLADELAQRRGAVLSVNERARQAELSRKLDELQPRILRLVSQPSLNGDENNELANLLAQRAAAEGHLAELGVALSQRSLAPLATVQEALSDNAGLVLWVDETAPGGLQEHWGCVVRPHGEPAWEPLSGTGPGLAWTDEDDSLPSRLREALTSGRGSAAEVQALAEALRKQRMAPLAKHLIGVQALYVVAVNAMKGIPAELLAQEYAVSYVPSGAFLAWLHSAPAPSAPRTLLALGDPVFQRRGERRPPATDLPPGGLLISMVVPGGAADRANLRRGDVLVAYGDTRITSVESLQEALRAHADPLEQVSVTLWREGVEEPFTRSLPARLDLGVSREDAREAIANRRRLEAMVLAMRGGDWKELPGSRVELAQLGKLFGTSVTSLAGSSASEQALDKLRKQGRLSKYRYLHFATHGHANHASAMESALILAQDALTDAPLPRAGEPFLDGRLSAQEVLAYWDLDAELVTLSACETALGRSGGGDGFLGFAQAFLVAGSRAVCLSLWDVDDTATALLMARFYQNLLGRRPRLPGPMGKAAALTEAKHWLRDLPSGEAQMIAESATREVRKKDVEVNLAVPVTDAGPLPAESRPFSHPRFWSAFILLGDPN